MRPLPPECIPGLVGAVLVIALVLAAVFGPVKASPPLGTVNVDGMRELVQEVRALRQAVEGRCR